MAGKRRGTTPRLAADARTAEPVFEEACRHEDEGQQGSVLLNIEPCRATRSREGHKTQETSIC